MRFANYYQGNKLNEEELKKFNYKVKVKRTLKGIIYSVFLATMFSYIIYHLNH